MTSLFDNSLDLDPDTSMEYDKEPRARAASPDSPVIVPSSPIGCAVEDRVLAEKAFTCHCLAFTTTLD
ncbi:hypothetical protein PG993_008215 [Apiospora rasikravindrae]|uniref:Uncharacterized protein n=1 Tax=Apiospora rasikravindrae TaxID=990691 RepID=A0ABR1SZQ1_9PEZI